MFYSFLLENNFFTVKSEVSFSNRTARHEHIVSDSVLCSRTLQQSGFNLCILYEGQSPHSLCKPAIPLTRFDEACCAGASFIYFF